MQFIFIYLVSVSKNGTINTNKNNPAVNVAKIAYNL